MARPLSKRPFFHIVRQGGGQGPELCTARVLRSRSEANGIADTLSKETPGVRFYVLRSTYGHVTRVNTSTTKGSY